MPVPQSVQQRKLTSVLKKKTQKLPAISDVISPVFYTLFPWTSVRMAKVLSSYRFVSVVFVVVVLVMCSLVSPRLTSHFCLVHQFLVFFLPFFSQQPSFRNVVENVFRLFLLSFSHFSIANFKQCWVICPYFSRFPPFQNSHHPSFPLPSPKPLPVLPPPILPSSRPRSTSTKLFVHFRFACTVNPLLFRSCLEVLFESPLNVPLPSPLSRQKCA